MTKPFFKKIEVYITNVCNLTCNQCNRFNNFDFKGWQRWSDYADQYKRWGELIDLKAITIMGGEPTLNPTLPEWILGLNNAFGIEVQVLTNGTRLTQCRGLYDAIAHARPRNGKRNSLAVSLHNLDDLSKLQEDIYKFLPGKVEQNTYRPDLWNSNYQYSDQNGVFINVYNQNSFNTAAMQNPSPGKYILFNNDPVEAHNACGFVRWKSYHFIKANLYKCGPVALLPEFDQQIPLDISSEDRAILHSYRPLTVENYDSYHEEFLANLDNPIPHCKFCPANADQKVYTIAPVHKGSSTIVSA
jgi:organic radical activating enzyme